MIKIKRNWACLKVCEEEGKGHNCLQKWNRQRETRAEKRYCSRRLPLQRIPLHIRATYLCPHFKVVVVGVVFARSRNLGTRSSLYLGVRRWKVLDLSREVGRKREVSLPSQTAHFASPCRIHFCFVTQRPHGRLEHCVTIQISAVA